jgi:hypothetical protein
MDDILYFLMRALLDNTIEWNSALIFWIKKKWEIDRLIEANIDSDYVEKSIKYNDSWRGVVLFCYIWVGKLGFFYITWYQNKVILDSKLGDLFKMNKLDTVSLTVLLIILK